MSINDRAEVNQNSLLTTISMNSAHQVVTVRENGFAADANFIVPHLMKQILTTGKNKICLVIMHNTIGHYYNTGRKLNYDLMKQVQNGDVIPIEPMKYIIDNINDCSSNGHYLSDDKEAVVRQLFLSIKSNIEKLLRIGNTDRVYLIFDDISHFLDLCINVKLIITFINCCINLGSNVSLIVNCHVDTECDEIISNALEYVANLSIVVLPLKTGFSHDVGGLIVITDKQHHPNQTHKHHYKADEVGIKVFSVGESLCYLST